MKDPGGAPIPYDPNQKTKTANLDPGLAALIGYVVALWAVIIIVTEPKEHKFTRFHAFQALFLWVAGGVTATVLGIVFGIVSAGLALIGNLVYLAIFVIGVLIGLKAKNGETRKLPVIAPFAEKFA